MIRNLKFQSEFSSIAVAPSSTFFCTLVKWEVLQAVICPEDKTVCENVALIWKQF